MADVPVRSFKFQVMAVYAPTHYWEKCSFFRRLEPFQACQEPLVLVEDWNVIPDSKIDKVE